MSIRTKIRDHLSRHFATYVFVTNAMVAISIAAFSVLGVFSSMISTPILIVNAIVFGMLYAVGKFGNEQLEDLPKIEAFEKGHTPCSNT
jgi:hypothetical protein